MTNTRTKDIIINDIIKLFAEDEELFNNCIEELDSYNGYLGDDRYYYMEELEEFYNNNTGVVELLKSVHFGYSEDETYTDKHGQIKHCQFNPNQEYFRYNGYGNLVSSYCKDYTGFLDDWFVENLLKYRQEVYSIEDDARLVELLDELEELEQAE